MKNILFIINPIAGKKAGKNINKEIVKYLDTNLFKVHFRYSEYHGHISEIASQALTENFDIVVAVGGDGTVNETARIIVHSNLALGIIPMGSGNGLARHLKIPLSVKRAVETLNRMTIQRMDAIKINGSYSFCVAGAGFDAEVSKEFQKMKARGLLSYIVACIKCFKQSKNRKYILRTDNEEHSLLGFMLCFANASQFGNDAYIAPKADISDGLVNVVLIAKPSLLQIPLLAYRIFTKTIEKYPSWRQLLVKSIEVEQESNLFHIDGELMDVGNTIKVSVEQNALRIIY